MSLYEPNDFDEDDPLYELGDVLFNVMSEYGVAIYRSVHPDDSWFIVRSTDFVANEWRSLHRTLAAALAHVSAIQYCAVESVTLTVSSERLAVYAEAFHRAVTWSKSSSEKENE